VIRGLLLIAWLWPVARRGTDRPLLCDAVLFALMRGGGVIAALGLREVEAADLIVCEPRADMVSGARIYAKGGKPNVQTQTDNFGS